MLKKNQRHPRTLVGFSQRLPVPKDASTNDSRDSFKLRCKLHGVNFVHIDFALVMTAWMKPDAESIMSRPRNRFYPAIFRFYHWQVANGFRFHLVSSMLFE